MRNHSSSQSFQQFVHMQKESCIYNRFNFFRRVFEYPRNQLGIYLFHNCFKWDSRLHWCKRKRLISFMKLHKLINEVELSGMYVVELKNILFRVLNHCFVEPWIHSKNISLYFVLFTIFGLYYVDLSSILHPNIIFWLGN